MDEKRCFELHSFYFISEGSPGEDGCGVIAAISSLSRGDSFSCHQIAFRRLYLYPRFYRATSFHHSTTSRSDILGVLLLEILSSIRNLHIALHF